MAQNDVLRLVVTGRVHGQTVMNVHHYQQTSSQAGNRSAELAAAWIVANEPTMLACLSDEYQLIGYTVQVINPLPVLAAYQELRINKFGTINDESLPTSVAVVLTKRTALAGPKFRGRTYLGGIPVTHEVDSKVTGAAINLYHAFADKLQFILAEEGLATFTPIIYNRSTQTSTSLTECEATDILRNQRRRQVGRGI